jgi:DNA-binding FadR family transcriptional regulator
LLQSLRIPPLHDAIQRQVKQYILDRGLRPGDRLPTEEQISREIGVSRNVVREALRGLESIGLVEARHGDGRFVRRFNFDAILDNLAYAIYFDRHSFDELMEVRGELEVAFIGRAAHTLDASDIAALWQSVDGMRRRVALGQAFLDEDVIFHSCIFSRLGNQLLLRLLEIFWKVSSALQSSGDLQPPSISDLADACDNHARITEALERHDEAGARTAMELHFDYARAELSRRYAAALDQQASQTPRGVEEGNSDGRANHEAGPLQ